VTTGVAGFDCTIEFEGGSEKGVYSGLEFWYPPGFPLISGKVTITRVEARSCTGHLTAFGGEKEQFKPPTEGETVSTARDAVPAPAAEKPGEKPAVTPPVGP